MIATTTRVLKGSRTKAAQGHVYIHIPSHEQFSYGTSVAQ